MKYQHAPKSGAPLLKAAQTGALAMDTLAGSGGFYDYVIHHLQTIFNTVQSQQVIIGSVPHAENEANRYVKETVEIMQELWSHNMSYQLRHA